MPYCIYLRKSRADAEAERHGGEETLGRHKRTLLEFAQKNGYAVAEIYHEVVSGDTIAQRPEMRRLLGDVQAGIWDGVLVMEVERLARGDTMDQGIVEQTFKYSGTWIITPAKVFDPGNEFDEEYFEFSLFMSRREYKTIRRRQEAGKEAACREGRWIWNIAPYGYRRIRNEDGKGFRLAPDPQEAGIIRKIFSWYVEGDPQPDGTRKRLGVSLICRKLNSLGLPTRSGDSSWAAATVSDILKNPVYIGKIRRGLRRTVKKMEGGKVVISRPHNPEAVKIYEGLHDPLVSGETFQKAQECLASNRPPAVPGHRAVKNPLAGIVVCGQCGRKMVRRPYQNGRAPLLICYAPNCPNVGADVGLVERRLLEGISDWIETYTVEERIDCAESDAADRDQLAALVAEAAALEKQLETAYRFFERGIYTEEEFFARRVLINAGIGRISASRAAVIEEIRRKQEWNLSAGSFAPKRLRILEAYGSATAAGKNAILREVVEKVIYRRDTGGRHTGVYDNFTLEIFPRLSKGT